MTRARSSSSSRWPSRWVPLVAGLVIAAVPSGAGASAWDVTVEALVQGVAGTSTVPLQFRVQLPDPAGSVTALGDGVPFAFSHTASTFSASVIITQSFAAGCVTTVAAAGSAPVQTTGGGSVASGPFSGSGVDRCPSGEFPFSIGGSFTARSLDLAPAPSATVEAASGTVTVKTPLASQRPTAGSSLVPGSLIQTGADGSATVAFAGGTRLFVAPDSQVTLLPPAGPAGDDVELGQIRGALTHLVAGASSTRPDRYRVRTPVATIRSTGTAFVSRYGESAGAGELVVSVDSGLVEVENRGQVLTLLLGGTEAAFVDTVPRVTLILPVDGGEVARGRVNTFSWTAFAGAAGYLFEYTLAPAGFAQSNPSAAEPASSLLRVGAALFTQTAGTVEFPLAVSAGAGSAGARARWRVFPTDAAGRTLPGTTASDAGAVVLP